MMDETTCTVTLSGLAGNTQDITPLVEKALKELLAPAGRLEMLKRKPFLSGKEVEELYGISEGSLRTMRTRGGGPAYVQPYKNGPVQYEHEAIKIFQARGRLRG